MMRKFLLMTLLWGITLTALGQNDGAAFRGTIYNKEYMVYLRMDFENQSVKVPGQEIFGELPGFLGDEKDSRKWLVTGVEVKGKTAHLEIINDYGSEDLEAELTLEKDGSYTLRQKQGSTIKIARNRKWVKLPKQLRFTTTKQ